MNRMEELREENPRFETGISSIIGTRSYQQDFAFLYTDRRDLAALVCDGMGGLEGGERASRTAAELFAADLKENGPGANIPGFLHREAKRMDKAVSGLKNGEGKPLKAGTTMVGVYCRGNEMNWVSVGDSRIYVIRGGQIAAQTRDHNYRLLLKEQLAAGQITRNFYETEEKTPQAEALTSFLGMNGLRLLDVNRTRNGNLQGARTLLPEDIVLLCSDGVYKSLSDSQILAMVRDNDIDMNIAADRLTAMALRYGVRGQDNTTVILLRYRGEQEES